MGASKVLVAKFQKNSSSGPALAFLKIEFARITVVLSVSAEKTDAESTSYYRTELGSPQNHLVYLLYVFFSVLMKSFVCLVNV